MLAQNTARDLSCLEGGFVVGARIRTRSCACSEAARHCRVELDGERLSCGQEVEVLRAHEARMHPLATRGWYA
jgi:hypothetical protein